MLEGDGAGSKICPAHGILRLICHLENDFFLADALPDIFA